MGVYNEPQYKKELIDYFSIGLGIATANGLSKKLFEAYTKELNAKNFEKADKILVKCHITSATFKALASWKAIKVSSEIATRNVYTVFRTTGLPYSYNNILPSATYEGDNSVLLQQTARFILVKDKGEDLAKPESKVRDDDLNAVITMLKYVTSMEVRRLKKIFGKEFEAGVSMKTFWNEKHQRDIIDVSKLWGVLQLLEGFADSLKQMTDLKSYFAKIGKVFTKNLLIDVPQVYAYGFVIEEVDSWKEFTAEQYWALTHFTNPMNIPFEEQKLL